MNHPKQNFQQQKFNKYCNYIIYFFSFQHNYCFFRLYNCIYFKNKYIKNQINSFKNIL